MENASEGLPEVGVADLSGSHDCGEDIETDNLYYGFITVPGRSSPLRWTRSRLEQSRKSHE